MPLAKAIDERQLTVMPQTKPNLRIFRKVYIHG